MLPETTPSEMLMAGNQATGKFAFLLHADVAGSTSLVQRDEHLAHQRIQDTFHRFSRTIARYQGQVRELRGDALLAEFERASDALSAALVFQSEQRDYLAGLDDSIRPAVRVGVAMGEVVVADRTITGTGVVLAQRLEQLADPGGVVIQAAARETVPTRHPFDYTDLGQQRVKGFDRPIHAYAVSLRDGAVVPSPAHGGTGARNYLAALIVAILMLGGAGLMWWQPWEGREDPASVERMAFPLPDKPSIAVLPFTNMSKDDEQEYFVDGMTEDLITDLSKISGLFVIARNTVFTYKGKPVKVSQVAEELGVRYVLEGSVRRAGDQVRVNAQLIDATTGGHLWADRYDGTLTDVFGLQDQVTRKIVNALAVELTDLEREEREVVETSIPGAYDAFLEGWALYQKQTPEDFRRAREYLERAIELDPNFTRAYAALSSLYWETHIREWHPALKMDRWSVKRAAFRYRDLALENPTPLALLVAADMLVWIGKHGEAVDQAKRAIQLAPNDAYAHLKLAEILVFSGRPEEALEFVSNASRLDPYGESRQLYVRGLAEFGLERFESSSASLEKALQLNPDFAKPIAILVAVKGYLGDENAIDLLKPYSNEYWGTAVLNTVVAFPYKKEADRIRLEEGLRKAGMKEFDV